MIEHVWSVLCSRATFDRDSGNVTLIDVLEEITVVPEEGGPARAIQNLLRTPITLVSLWGREREDQPIRGRSRIFLLAPGFDVPQEIASYEIDLSEKLRMRVRGNMPGLPLQRTGAYTYRFRIEVQEEGGAEWRAVASLPLRIIMQPASGAEQNP